MTENVSSTPKKKSNFVWNTSLILIAKLVNQISTKKQTKNVPPSPKLTAAKFTMDLWSPVVCNAKTIISWKIRFAKSELYQKVLIIVPQILMIEMPVRDVQMVTRLIPKGLNVSWQFPTVKSTSKRQLKSVAVYVMILIF